MTFQTAMLATLILILGTAQYALCVQAIRDLVRRPRVRGENKVLWAIGILCIPIAGAIVYNWMGPTSFIHRPVASTLHTSFTDDESRYDLDGPASNVTPISAARSARQRRDLMAPQSPPSRTAKPAAGANRVGRTGS